MLLDNMAWSNTRTLDPHVAPAIAMSRKQPKQFPPPAYMIVSIGLTNVDVTIYIVSRDFLHSE